MKHFIPFALLAMTLVTTCNAAEDYQELIANSEARVYQAPDGAKLPYRLFKPDNYDPNKSYPLIIFLHGAGERGDDNVRQLSETLKNGGGEAAAPSLAPGIALSSSAV